MPRATPPGRRSPAPPPDEHWLLRTYREPEERSRAARVARRALPYATWALSFALVLCFLRGIDRYTARCKQLCYDGAFRTRVEGRHWTLYEGSWQWDAQQVLVAAALAVSLYGAWMAGRRSWGRSAGAMALAAALGAAWLGWVLQSPTPRDAIG